jgi:hypothetical protein
MHCWAGLQTAEGQLSELGTQVEQQLLQHRADLWGRVSVAATAETVTAVAVSAVWQGKQRLSVANRYQAM